MNITGRPIFQKAPKHVKDMAYLAAVHQLPCCVCGKHGVEAHHCRDAPDHGERGLYERLPGASMKSSDRDAIPLCPHDHWLFHNKRSVFHAKAGGKDYQFIAPTRAAIADMELDY